jgi:hypothetical protein
VKDASSMPSDHVMKPFSMLDSLRPIDVPNQCP